MVKVCGKGRWWLAVPAAVLAVAVAAVAPAAVPEVEIPVTRDLRADARQANARCTPILLVFSARTCSYCRVLEEEVLKPMLRSGQYGDRVLVRKVMLDDEVQVEGFDGHDVSPVRLSHDYNVRFTPTLLFLGPEGGELAGRLIGVNTLDFYGWYVDQAIDTANRNLRAGPTCG